MLRTFAMIAFGLAFTIWLTAWAVTSFTEHDASTGAARLEGLARDAVDALDDAMGGSAGSAADVSGEPDEDTVALEIGATGGRGVSLRSDCADGARIGGALRAGHPVELVSTGSGRCAGWTLVSYRTADGNESETWVRDAYLIETSPPPQATAPPDAEPPD